MKNANTTHTTPTRAAIDRAKLDALDTLAAKAGTPEAKAKAAKARVKADEATTEACALTAYALAPDLDEADRLEAKREAKTARAKADRLTDEADKAEAIAEADRAYFGHLADSRDLIAMVRIATEADREADRIATTAAKAREAARKATEAEAPEADTLTAYAEKLTEAATAAKAKATEAATTAPRYCFTIGTPPTAYADPARALSLAYSIATDTAAAVAVSTYDRDRSRAEAVAEADRHHREARDRYDLDRYHREAPAKLDPAAVRVYWNTPEHPEHITPAARMTAKKTAANAVMREGTPTQYAIDRAARARDWYAPDLYAMTDTAEVMLCLAVTADPDTAAKYRREARALSKLSAILKTLDPIADPAAVTRVVRAAEKYTTEAITDPARLKSRAEALTLALTAREALATADSLTDTAAALDTLTRAAFRAVNNHLTDTRSIRTNEAPPSIPLDTLTNEAAPLALDSVTPAEAARRVILREAAAEAVEALTPTRRRIFVLLAKGNTTKATARRLGKHHKTIAEHKKAIAATLAAAIVKAAPDSDSATAATAAAILSYPARRVNTATARAEAEAAPKLTAAAKATAKAREAYDKAREAAALAALIFAAAIDTDPAEAPAPEAATTAPEATAKAKATAKLTAAHKARAKAKARTEAEALAAAIKAQHAEAVAEAVRAAVDSLTPAARAVYDLTATGAGRNEIARRLSKGVATITEHKKNIAAKLAAAIVKAAPLDLSPEALAAADLAALAALATA